MMHTESVPLLGIEAPHLDTMSRCAGGARVEIAGGYHVEPYDRAASTDLVMVTEKGGDAPEDEPRERWVTVKRQARQIGDRLQSRVMTIQREPDRHRFFIPLGEYEALLMCAERNDILDFYHIYVPDPYRNRGIAGRLPRFAFDYARDHEDKVVASCPFIAGDLLPRSRSTRVW